MGNLKLRKIFAYKKKRPMTKVEAERKTKKAKTIHYLSPMSIVSEKMQLKKSFEGRKKLKEREKNMKKISSHFTEGEFTCNCGCGTFKPSKKLIDLLEAIRTAIWNIVGYECFCNVHCTVRCESHNRKVGGLDRVSRHLPQFFDVEEGAGDIHFVGISFRRLRKISRKLFKDGIITGGLGLYKWGIHVDTSSHRKWGKFWNNPTKKKRE